MTASYWAPRQPESSAAHLSEDLLCSSLHAQPFSLHIRFFFCCHYVHRNLMGKKEESIGISGDDSEYEHTLALWWPLNLYYRPGPHRELLLCSRLSSSVVKGLLLETHQGLGELILCERNPQRVVTDQIFPNVQHTGSDLAKALKVQRLFFVSLGRHVLVFFFSFLRIIAHWHGRLPPEMLNQWLLTEHIPMSTTVHRIDVTRPCKFCYYRNKVTSEWALPSALLRLRLLSAMGRWL